MDEHRNPLQSVNPADGIQPATGNVDKLTQLREKLALMQQINDLQTQQLQTNTMAIPVNNVKVPEGRYTMSLSDLKMYTRDCFDYQTLINYTDRQLVLQMRMNMDSDLKRTIDANHPDWRDKTVGEAVQIVNDIIKHSSNPTVYRKEFDNIMQESNETICEFVM